MKSLMLFLIAAIIALTFIPAHAFGQDGLNRCRDAFDRGDYLDAVNCLRDFVRKEKRNSEGFLLLGRALYMADSLDQAVAACVQARELDSLDARIYELLGDVYRKQNITVGAIQQYQRATELDTTRADLFIKLAQTNMKTRQYNAAAAAYWKAIGRDTTNIEVYRELSNLYIRANQHTNAIPLLQKLVGIDANASKEKALLVKAFFQTQNYTELIPLAEGIITKDSTDVDILRMLGIAYEKKGDNENAERTLLMLGRHDSLTVEDYIELGRAEKALDKLDDAIKAFENALMLDSATVEIYYDLGSLYMRRERFADAVTMFEKKLTADSSIGFRFASNLNAGICLMQLKEFQRARTHILAAVELRPEYVQAWTSLAQCYAQMADSVQPMRAAFRKVIELATAENNGNSDRYKKNLEEAYRLEGLHLLLDKKFPAAIDYLKKAIQIDPKNCYSLLWTAQAYFNSGNMEESKKYYCRVIVICPNNKGVTDDAKEGLKRLGEDPEECK